MPKTPTPPTPVQCDCLNFCGDDPWLRDGRARPCDSHLEHLEKLKLLEQQAKELATIQAQYGMPNLVQLALHLHQEVQRLKGEAGIYCEFLNASLDVIETITEGESDDWMMLAALKTKIRAAIEVRTVQL